MLEVAVGVETGVLAGVASIVWLMLHGSLMGRTVWIAPAEIAALVREELFTRPVFGLALHIAASGALGAILCVPAGRWLRSGRTLLPGLLAGLGIYVAGNLPLVGGRRLLVPMPIPDWSILAACLVFGMVLGAYPLLLRKARERSQPPERPLKLGPPTGPAFG